MDRVSRAVEKFEKAFRKFEEAVRSKRLEDLITDNDVLTEVVVKRFEYTFEALWKASKEFLKSRGVDCYSPRSCFGGLIKEGIASEEMEALLKELIEIRNELVHVYDEERAKHLYERIKSEDIYKVFRAVLEGLKKSVE
ncbi:MAG: DUF86 domain-containing protein [Aquificae bacterium]|nr:DUF86 domain-containing protein [Aquificota bacterium]